jgi:ferredoxin
MAMKDIVKKAEELLKNKKAAVVIGYGEGTNGKARAIFIRDAKNAEKLIYDDRCVQNIAVYLLKHEVKKFGKLAVVANTSVMRSILQLASENQIMDGDIEVIGITPDGKVIDMPDFESIEKHLASISLDLTKEEKEKLQEIESMSIEERWNYWQDQLARCIKCYACRASCPMCYCSRCTVDCNQPQWVPVPSHNQGNLEWHIMRAMHLAGRCVSCGECGRACPLDIPINLLTQKISEDVLKQFGSRAGTAAKIDFALSTFKLDDKENFIR